MSWIDILMYCLKRKKVISERNGYLLISFYTSLPLLWAAPLSCCFIITVHQKLFSLERARHCLRVTTDGSTITWGQILKLCLFLFLVMDNRGNGGHRMWHEDYFGYPPIVKSVFKWHRYIYIYSYSRHKVGHFP